MNSFRLLRSSGSDGISKVVNQFLASHPTYAKRQIEMKINEVSVKEKRGDDRHQVIAMFETRVTN